MNCFCRLMEFVSTATLISTWARAAAWSMSARVPCPGVGMMTGCAAMLPRGTGHATLWIGGNSKLTRCRVAERAHGWLPMLGSEALFSTARTAALSPAAVLADVLGLHPTTAAKWMHQEAETGPATQPT